MKIVMYLFVLAFCTMACKGNQQEGSEGMNDGAIDSEYHTENPGSAGAAGTSSDNGGSGTQSDTVTVSTTNGNSTSPGSGQDNTDSRNGRE